MTLTDHYAFRDSLTEALVRDLHGPAHGQVPTDDEVELTEPPIQRYITGILFPASEDPLDPVNDIDLLDEDEFTSPDPPIALANQRMPSSMGITFAVDPALAGPLVVEVTAARYEAADEATATARARRDPGAKWKRIPVSVVIDDAVDPRSAVADARRELVPGLELFWRVRPADEKGHVAVTVGLLNTFNIPPDSSRDQFSFFQPRVSVTATAPALVDRSHLGGVVGGDVELQSHRLLYKHIGNFATGHGCAAAWKVSAGDPMLAEAVWSTFTPVHDLLLADSNPAIESQWLGMQKLSVSRRPDVILGLREFSAGYSAWIESLVASIDALPESLQTIGHDHVADCRRAADRISAGIDHIEHDDLAWTAFQLMNEAMQRQRARGVWIASDGKLALDEADERHSWRPFQLGFVLLAIAGLIDPQNGDRSIVDLLWFPTGGGKTEAYLGLIAFTVFLRRLRGHRDKRAAGGMTVIMRYTLRLLTLQQFERAATLISACEVIRRERSDLGTDEISICLWVGRDATPLTLPEATKALNELGRGAEVPTSNPVQLHKCPWCGSRLTHKNYWVAQADRRLVIACRNTTCPFEKAIPAYVVDEDVYRRRPTLMIATVDKFASLAWRDSVASLFNIGHDEDPPELIIQDELHLISGPLGTLVGLYETAIDLLCERADRVGPKVIASTATIRRSKDQIRGLYGADRFQFPPPGLDARDSYFAVEVPAERKANRRYVGLMAPMTSHTTLLVRAYAALLEYASEIEEQPSVKDPYWTLVGYFNSLRVLGGALLQVRDDVPDRMQLLANRGGRDEARFESPELIELTSRESSSQIPHHLARMAVEHPDPNCIDVILATNMISVGVDIDRLGLMSVMGQPQSTSEYIQSTSRVGRRFPGLVTVLYNSGRSRDRSHYESFTSFHSAIYRQVDATSVTPFSARARDRALHAVLIAMMRTSLPKFRKNDGAANVATLKADAEPFVNRIIERVSSVIPDEGIATRKHLDAIVDEWLRRAQEEPKLRFQNQENPRAALLVSAAEAEVNSESFATLWSLRDVDTQSNMFLIGGGS